MKIKQRKAINAQAMNLYYTLQELLEWVKGKRGRKDINPYTVPEVRYALGILASIQDIADPLNAKTDEDRNWDEEEILLLPIYNKAVALFHQEEAAWDWFIAPNDALGGRSPFDCSETEEGTKEVEDLIGRM